MIEASVETLKELGIDESLVQREYFTSAGMQLIEDGGGDAANDTGVVHKAIVFLNIVVIELELSDRTNSVQAMVKRC